MPVIDIIKSDITTAMKSRDANKTSKLRTLFAEIIIVGKNQRPPRETTNAEALKTIETFAKNVREGIDAVSRMGGDVSALEAELSLYESYLPRKISEADMPAIIQTAVSETGATTMKDMRLVMAWLNERYAGQFDGKFVANIVKERLQ